MHQKPWTLESNDSNSNLVCKSQKIKDPWKSALSSVVLTAFKGATLFAKPYHNHTLISVQVKGHLENSPAMQKLSALSEAHLCSILCVCQ